MLYKGSSASKSREPWKKRGATQSPLRKEYSTPVAPAIITGMADTESTVDIPTCHQQTAAASASPAQTSRKNI